MCSRFNDLLFVFIPGKGKEYWEEENISEEMPACRQMFNIFHPFDPVAYRSVIVPLLHWCFSFLFCFHLLSRHCILLELGVWRARCGFNQLVFLSSSWFGWRIDFCVLVSGSIFIDLFIIIWFLLHT